MAAPVGPAALAVMVEPAASVALVAPVVRAFPAPASL
jgi:hypothetical protein